MSSLLWAFCYPRYQSPSSDDVLASPSESDSGSTDKPSSIVDPWGDSGTSTASGESAPTLPTESSSKTVSKYSPNHYQRGSIQVWDFIEDQKLDFFSGNVVKYLCRAGHKSYESEQDDLLKAKAFLDKKITSLQQERNR
jgi:hypothetical protein